MKLGSCPCCGSRNLKKLQGEQFTCLDCNAPLRFTWSAAHGVGIVLPMTLPNLMQQFSDPIRYGIPAVLLVVLLILYFRFRRFHLDEFGIAEAISAAQEELRYIDKFIAGKIGVIDFIGQVDELKATYVQEPTIRSLIQDHFNRVGGLSAEEQASGFAAIHPYVDLNNIAHQQQQETSNRIARLNAYKLQI